MRNDSILSTLDIPFVRLFSVSEQPSNLERHSSGARLSVISPRPCLPVPAGAFEIRKDDRNFLVAKGRFKLRDENHKYDYQGWWRMHTAYIVSHERPSKHPRGLQSSGSAASGVFS
jgi:hypothetical protein